MTRLLEPFLKSFPIWAARPWLLAILLLLAPAAYFAGRYFQGLSGATSMHEMEGYGQIVRRARVTAKSLGIPAGNWNAAIRFEANSEMNRFAQRARARIPEALRRLLPVTKVRVLMMDGTGKWVEFTYSGEGHLLGYEASPRIFSPDEMLAQTGTREVAQAAVEAVVDPAAFEFGEASARTTDGGMGQRFDWSLGAKCCPELFMAAAVEVVGHRPSYLGIGTFFQSDYLRRRSTPLNLLADVLRLGFLIGGTIFVGLRFARRAMEREVPYKRAAVVGAVVFLVGLILVGLQPFGEANALEPIFLAGPSWSSPIIESALTSLIIGVLLALAYGATEGDLREWSPGKLTSFDALLSGRLFSQNAGVSIAAGAAWGAWVYVLAQGARAWLAPGFIPLPETELRFSYSVAPWLGLLSINLADAIRTSVTVLLVALSVGIWLGRTTRQRRFATAICSCSAVLIAGSPFTDANAGLVAVVTLATLWLGLAGLDFLGAVAALVVTAGGTSLADLQALLPAWREPAALALAVGVTTLLAALVTTYRGRRYDDAEVMPSYARNIEQRHSRQEEVSAAREAQLRLMPLAPPEIAGLGIAAFCAPSQRGVSGDFFDFYPMSHGRLGLLMADGRTGGLGAALIIALAKGFVQYAAQRDWPAGETLRRLRELWHRDGRRDGDLNLAFAVFDPARRQVRFARLGPTPVMLAGFDAFDKAEPLHGLEADGVTEGAATFGNGDVLLLYTDGVPNRFAQSHRDGLDAWLRNKLRLATGVTAYRIGEALQEALRTQDRNAPDDLTAVVIRFEQAESVALEVGA